MLIPAVLLLLAAGPPDVLASCAWVRAENDGAGGGFVVDTTKRLLVTCRHVVADRGTVDVFFPWHRDGRLVTDRRDYLGNRPLLRERGLLVAGKVVKKSDEADLALVELESLPADVTAVRFAANPARPGDPLRVAGHRLDLDTLWNFTTGPVRQTGRLADGYPWRGRKLAVNADAVIGQLPIEEGDSGGPVLNAAGELVGMASALRRQCPIAAVAVSSAEVRKFLAIEEPKAKPAAAGIADALTRATVWVRPTATDVHLAGVLFEPNLMLTCSHGLGPTDRVGVAFPLRDGDRWIGERAPYRDPVGLHLKGAWRQGTVLARDSARDLAVIRLDSVPAGVKPLSLAARLPAAGDAVHAMSHPGGLEFAWVYAAGSVRQRGPIALADGEKAARVEVNVLQLPAQSGSPGGPVVNDRGELVGVLSARESAQQTAYAATADEITRFLHAALVAGPTRSVPHLLALSVRAERFEHDWLSSRAAQAIESKEWRAARGDLDRILDVNPADTAARRQLAHVLLELDKDDEAATAVADTLRADPKRLPTIATDLLAQADAIAAKFPDTPSAPAAWLRKALAAVHRTTADTGLKDALAAVLKRAADAKDDAARLTVLRGFVETLRK